MTPSAATWRRVIAQAHDGAPRHLLELLLEPQFTDNRGVAVPGPKGERPFYELPDDAELRLAIVRALLFGPHGAATTVQELMTHEGWGKKKPSVAEVEIGLADLLRQVGASAQVLDQHAETLGVTPDTLRKRIDARRKPKK